MLHEFNYLDCNLTDFAFNSFILFPKHIPESFTFLYLKHVKTQNCKQRKSAAVYSRDGSLLPVGSAQQSQ